MFGDKCTRCGDCCAKAPCGIALAFVGDIRPCPALEKRPDGKYDCGLLVHASQYIAVGEQVQWKDDFLKALFAHMLGVGMGCCSSPDGEVLHGEVRKAFALLEQKA